MKNKLNMIGGLMVAVGVAVFLAGFWCIGSDFRKITTEPPYTQKTYIATTACTAISVRDTGTDVEIVAADVDAVRISYEENEKKFYEITESHGTITVEKRSNLQWYDYIFNIRVVSPMLKVEVPRALLESLEIENKNGSVSAEGIEAQLVRLVSTNSAVRGSDIVCGGELHATSRNGRVQLENVAAGGALYCTASNDTVFLQAVSAADVHIENSNGGVALLNITSAGNIDAVSSNDDIRLERVDFAGTLTCEMRNGGIYGSVRGMVGDFSFNCEAANGACNLPDVLASGEKQIYLRTSNDDIEVHFVP